MTFPAIVFSFFLASIFGSLMHIWRNGGLFRLVLYLVLSWIGFFAGHIIAQVFSINFFKFGHDPFRYGYLRLFGFIRPWLLAKPG